VAGGKPVHSEIESNRTKNNPHYIYKLIWKWKKVLIPVVSSIAVLMTILHEAGYARYFGMQLKWIEYNTSMIYLAIIFIIAFTVLLVLCYFVLKRTFNWLHKQFNIIEGPNNFLITAPCVLTFVLIAEIFGLLDLRSGDPKPITFFVLVIILVPILVYFYFTERIRPLYVIMAWVVFLLTVSYASGQYQAKNKSSFWISTNNEKRVVLRFYRNNMVLAPLGRKPGTVQKLFYVVSIASDTNRKNREENLGKLIPVEPELSESNKPD